MTKNTPLLTGRELTQAQRKELYQQLKSKTFSEDENNMISQSINNRWNRVLLETKCLRNYFVDEAVVPSKKVTAADQNFLNKKMFEGHFLSMMKERYGVETPAILHFFRDRFICCQYAAKNGENIEKKEEVWKFGQSLEEHFEKITATDASEQQSPAVHQLAASLSNNVKHFNNSNLESMHEDLGQQAPTKEYMSMLKCLQALSTRRSQGFSSASSC